MLNTIFIVWLFRIEGAGNLHLPVAKINLYYGEKGGIVRTTMMETVFIMSTMILLNSIFTVWLFWSEGAGNLSSPFWVLVKSQQKAVVKLLNACGLRERIPHMVIWGMGTRIVASTTNPVDGRAIRSRSYVRFDVHLFENFERVHGIPCKQLMMARFVRDCTKMNHMH